ncbi:oligoendopeptidase F [candidate division KSB1 bacterium]|nr:oligoendopeptidase F [candidate division KSB1 bacterium]
MAKTFLSAAGKVLSQTCDRAEVPTEYTWNLNDLYPSLQDWKSSKEKIVAQWPQVLQYKGKLSASAADLFECLELRSELSRELVRLYIYAHMKSDQDTRDANMLALKQEMEQIAVDFSTQMSFIEPEIVAMAQEQIDRFVSQEKRLQVFKFYLNDIQRRKAHKLSQKEEKIIAEAGLMADAPYSIYSIFANADLPYPTVKLTDGTEVLVDQAGYHRYRASANRDDREIIFKAFFKALNNFHRTIGTQLYANLKKDLFYAKARGYETCLHSALDENNIPPAVYHSLVRNINDNLPTFHRYLKLRRRMLGVDQLKYIDLYAPVVKGVELHYTYDEAKQIILEALQPLGKDYLQVVEHCFKNRWIDVYPTKGKKSGAYANGSGYDIHPYILLNYIEQYHDVATLAHELGHAMHSYYSNKTQPYPLSDYPIFVAEVASTMNEALLIDYMLKKIDDEDVRLSLLMSYLDGIKGTLFRQTQFAEFELRIHEAVERGEPLTGDHFTEMYGDIFKKYYGHEQGVCLVDDIYAVEWAFIPHFYYNYYVYQYATSHTASTALSEMIIAGEKGAVAKFRLFLSAGGSAYPIDLLKTAGVDMTLPEPFHNAMAAMNRTMDEIEKILDKNG